MQFRISTATHKSHVQIRAFCGHEFTAYRVEILKNSPACTKRAKQEIPARHHR